MSHQEHSLNDPTSLYADWNYLLLSEYFSPAPKNEDVWIQTSRHELDSFGIHLGGSVGLIEAVKQGPAWFENKAQHSANAALRLVKQRQPQSRPVKYEDPSNGAPIYQGLNAPTYLPYVALWVLASSEADEGFYTKVSTLLNQPFPNTPALTLAMESVWKDLERWSTLEAAGRFGVFKVRILGEHRFVGIPKSQCMISRKDVNGVRQLFSSCDLRPRQELSPELFNRILEYGGDAHYLSNSLKYAMHRPAYHEPLRHLLSEMLDFWDGRPPKTQGVQAGQNQGVHMLDDLGDELVLKLAPSGEDASGWEIRWRFPASGQAIASLLVIDGNKIPCKLEPSGGFFSSSGLLHQDVSMAALLRSATQEVQVGVEYDDEEAYEVGGGVRTCRVAIRELRLLVWDTPDPRLGDELVERDLPISGPLYLLCSASFRSQLELYLEHEGITNKLLPTGGLPPGWGLTCITQAERLTTDQRYWLTDGNAMPDARARIRFVGGRPIVRGGARLYVHYDLPLVELEAPAGTVPVAEGLKFEEIGLYLGKHSLSSIRRFKIQIHELGRVAFEIRATRNSEELTSVRLRVSFPESTGVGDLRHFGLDCFGRSIPSRDGLRGAIIGVHMPDFADTLEDKQMGLCQEHLQIDSGFPITKTVSAKFLDSLAQLGSIAYGAARDQINRLAESDGAFVQPALLLLELRSRGHLEIQTDDKGHLVRIHAVPPTLYSLPVHCDGLTLFGVCGTLRLQHWIDLSEKKSCIAYVEEQPSGRLPSVRLAVLDSESAQEIAQSLSFLISWNPSNSISKWAGSLERATSELSSWGWGAFSAHLGQLQRLNPESAQFSGVNSNSMTVDAERGRQLFRLDDPSVIGLQVYILGSIQPNGTSSFSFIHDSRWGVWISISAFAEMLKDRYSIDNASPWPIHYDASSRNFWFPARLRPPSIIERALVFCSGCGPLEVKTKGIKRELYIGLINERAGTAIGNVSSVYEKFGSGTWLCYRWVPMAVAQRIAKLLSGEIRPFSL